ncbi:unnamed protein product [Paramecium primaurelia]|uniref:Uncharacterized protein n=1 Tax=Paramecium primaurelia TaxID=5886 RepID=A0A8S1NYG8_PARPR|nr:unnamed protein product [Paramecium primaurelia]
MNYSKNNLYYKVYKLNYQNKQNNFKFQNKIYMLLKHYLNMFLKHIFNTQVMKILNQNQNQILIQILKKNFNKVHMILLNHNLNYTLNILHNVLFLNYNFCMNHHKEIMQNYNQHQNQLNKVIHYQQVDHVLPNIQNILNYYPHNHNLNIHSFQMNKLNMIQLKDNFKLDMQYKQQQYMQYIYYHLLKTLLNMLNNLNYLNILYNLNQYKVNNKYYPNNIQFYIYHILKSQSRANLTNVIMIQIITNQTSCTILRIRTSTTIRKRN